MLGPNTSLSFPTAATLAGPLSCCLAKWEIQLIDEPSVEAESQVKAAMDRFGNKFAKPSPLRIEYDHRVRPHPHAATTGRPIDEQDYYLALADLLAAKTLGAAELNFHIPLEVGCKSHRDLVTGAVFMSFVDTVGRALGIAPVWENAPILTPPDWSIVENLDFIPPNHALCLDIGHLMLGATSRDEALARIDNFLEKHRPNVKHLHLHINDLRRDQHINDPAEVVSFLGLDRFKQLTAGRTYIFERGL